MELSAYLDRIGFDGVPAPDLATLRVLQRSHLSAIPYENLDVQLGRPVSLERADAFAKVVHARRGGWCYEMNGLFWWALEAIGYRVAPMTGAVMRATRGDSAIGNHLVLRVELDRSYLVDVGVADGPTAPLPIAPGTYAQGWRTFRIEVLDDGWWRFHNSETAFAPSFDFSCGAADWRALRNRCHWQQTSPDSRFVQNAIAVRHRGDGIDALVGRVWKRIDGKGSSERLIASETEYVAALADTFGLQLGGCDSAHLWPKIVARHDALFGARR